MMEMLQYYIYIAEFLYLFLKYNFPFVCICHNNKGYLLKIVFLWYFRHSYEPVFLSHWKNKKKYR